MEINNDADYESYRRRVFDFLWREVEPLAGGIERSGNFPNELLFPKFREHGLWGLLIPRAYGGLGLTTAQYLPFLAEFSKVAGVVRVLLHVHNTSARAVVGYGTEAQKEKLLPALALGDSSLTFALTEPNSGSGMDVACRAVRDGDGHRDDWVVNGTKHYITNAGFADLHLVCCRTGAPDERRDRRALSALVIPTGTPGFTIEPMPRLMGNNGPHHGILRFEDARVPAASMIGAQGDGLDVFLGELEPSRAFVAASSLGAAERALEIALDFSRRRVTFGKSIAARPSVQAELAEMARDVYALRLILDDVAAKIDRREACALETSIAKLTGLETVMRVTDKALDVLGGRGYFADYPYPLERIYREARINLAEEGTPSIQRLVMARALLDLPAPLAIGTLGAPYQPDGTDPALGRNAPPDLSYAHGPENPR
jgi:alkylation response protein AidB-like acyl-CoA dehydrogenase